MGRVVGTPVDTTFARRACSACDAGPGMAVTTLRLRAMDATAAVVTSVEVCIVSAIIVSAYRRGTLSEQKLTANLSRGAPSRPCVLDRLYPRYSACPPTASRPCVLDCLECCDHGSGQHASRPCVLDRLALDSQGLSSIDSPWAHYSAAQWSPPARWQTDSTD